MDDRAQAIPRLFDSLADDYDQVGVDFFQPIAGGLVRELAPRPGERALDVGCGRGAALIAIARAVGPSGHVTGVDLAPRMVEAAARDAAAAGVDVELVVGDASRPPVTGPYDLVASSLVLFFLPDPVAALREWRALLAEDGRVGVSTFGAYSGPWTAVEDVLRPYSPPEVPNPQAVQTAFDTDEGVEGLLTDAGFTDVRTTSTTLPVRFDDEEHWFRWSLSQGQRRMWMAVPEDERDEVRERALVQVRQCRDAEGRIGFDQVVRYTLGRRG